MNMSEFMLSIVVIIVICMMYVFILRPVHRRYDAVFNHLLAKEIARRLYQETHPEFSYKVYHEDDLQRQIILGSAVKEFRRLVKKNS